MKVSGILDEGVFDKLSRVVPVAGPNLYRTYKKKPKSWITIKKRKKHAKHAKHEGVESA